MRATRAAKPAGFRLVALLLTLALLAAGCSTNPAGSSRTAAAASRAASSTASSRAASRAASGLSYVAMGSSFAAGPGIEPAEPGSPAGCVRSARNYANLVAAQIGARLTDVSCIGATTDNILTHRQGGRPPQIDAVGRGTRLVTVTIGGNDIDYFGSLSAYSCHDGGSTSCHLVDVGAIERTLPSLTGRLENVVTAIRARAPHARVLLVTYFTVLPAAGGCANVPLSAGHLAFERSLAATLAQDTATAAHATGATLVDLAGASEQHDACSTQPWVNAFYTTSGDWPYHPTPAGMAGAARLIEQTLAAKAT
ncbi:SGNH/GDSL hydrolase family protein [Actinospica robiniae]|uniref:SGNH/GDSL hydrolase family protein n=1 Tax=Actinospica robiniae TaxID=304901 RepID=UPI0004137FF1|nr:SGNH/GDSL hydrolase family protein [Actinospica robiniae]